jgi:2-amino-4-hydroxy-6-hydroxymethyldihydropteridine diphosphokinase
MASPADGAGPGLPARVVRAYVGIGANLGEASASVIQAIAALAALPGCSGLQASPLYRTAPVAATGPDYCNAVAAFDTDLTPQALLAAMQRIELAFGRQRPYPNAPRTLDLDLLLHGETVLQTPSLTLPHPRLHQRAFVLRPLLDLAPALVVAGLGALVACLPACADQGVEKLATP